MQVKSIIFHSASLLDKQNVVNYLTNGAIDGDAVAETNKLLSLTRLVVEDLISAQFYVSKKRYLNIDGCKFKVNVIATDPLKIFGFYNSQDKKIDFRIEDSYVITSEKPNYVIFADRNMNIELDGSIDFENNLFRINIIVYGVIAEYYLSVGDFDSACVWHEKFVNALKQIKNVKNCQTKERSWV